jgi:hypothetical protein
MIWKVGADEDDAALDDDFPFADAPVLHRERKTGFITKQPNGNPWTWAAVNALTNVRVNVEYNIPGPAIELLHLNVSEVWVEVYGVGGATSNRRKVRFKLAQGFNFGDLYIGMPSFRLAPGLLQQTGLTIGVPRFVLSIGMPSFIVEM